MENGLFTIFARENGAPAWMEELWYETTDEEKAKAAIRAAKKKGYTITRVYSPRTHLDAPKFN